MHPTNHQRLFPPILLCVLLPLVVRSFNIDTDIPVVKVGPRHSYFGYAVQLHWKGDEAVMLVGAPRANSTQPSTVEAGVLYNCKISTYSRQGQTSSAEGDWCEDTRAEYGNHNRDDDYAKPPNLTSIFGQAFHSEGKNRQYYASALSSAGVRGSQVVVCAPLARFNEAAFTTGVCYVLRNDLTMRTGSASCLSLPRTGRHNEYGACLEGHSVLYDEYEGDGNVKMMVKGVPGAKRWRGGATASNMDGQVRRSFAVAGVDERDVEEFVHTYSYTGFSVGAGYFGFRHEQRGKRGSVTVISGATRFNESGAVIFMQYEGDYSENLEENDNMFMFSDRFVLTGDASQLASAYGYAVEVMDINNDGFDDLLVGAPFHYSRGVKGASGVGGAVYVYFSTGVKQAFGAASTTVFEAPIVLLGGDDSQFGASIANCGDLNMDGYQDFLIGSPYAENGGAVYLYHGAASADKFSNKTVQTIYGSTIDKDMAGFGFAISANVDVDGNGYPDALIGAFESDQVALLRTRPIIHVEASVEKRPKTIDKDLSCSESWAHACFDITTGVTASQTGDTRVSFDSDVFTCTLTILPIQKSAALRASFDSSGTSSTQWPCGRNSDQSAQGKTHTIYVPVRRLFGAAYLHVNLQKTTRDFLSALKFSFTIELTSQARPRVPSPGQPLPALDGYPVLDATDANLEFTIPFNKKCGDDNECKTDLQTYCAFSNLAKDPKTDVYTKHVGLDDTLDMQITIKNLRERAYEAMFHVVYDWQELNRPTKGARVVDEGGREDGQISYSFGNPFNAGADLTLTLRFTISRGKSVGIGRELMFELHTNSTSLEMQPEDNNCTAAVKVIKEAEIEVIGVSDPELVHYGGELKGESLMAHEEDIGPMVVHRYTVTNHGPWSVSDARVLIEWPYEVQSPYAHGKWALYLMSQPVIRTSIPGQRAPELRLCRLALPAEQINPLELSQGFSSAGTSAKAAWVNDDDESEISRRQKRSSYSSSPSSSSSTDPSWLSSKQKRSMHRIKSTKVTEGGEVFDVVVISCAHHPSGRQRTAKCFTITCDFPILDAGVSSTIEIHARLWNATFVEDYRDVEYVRVESTATAVVDERQGVHENNTDNNFAIAITRAYPDLPQMQEDLSVPIWAIILAILIALLILALIVLCCWKCGFFKRKRQYAGDNTLYKAELHAAEEWQTAR